MSVRIYESDQDVAEWIDPIDPDEVAVVGFNWEPWMSSIGESNIDVYLFAGSTGIVVGDGITAVTKGTLLVTPPAPALAGFITAAHVWIDGTVEVGDEVTVTNTIRVGTRVTQRTLRMKVAQR